MVSFHLWINISRIVKKGGNNTSEKERFVLSNCWIQCCEAFVLLLGWRRDQVWMNQCNSSRMSAALWGGCLLLFFEFLDFVFQTWCIGQFRRGWARLSSPRFPSQPETLAVCWGPGSCPYSVGPSFSLRSMQAVTSCLLTIDRTCVLLFSLFRIPRPRWCSAPRSWEWSLFSLLTPS